METGTIKKLEHNHGFITPSEMGQRDYYFSFSSAEGEASDFSQGMAVQFERVPGKANLVENVRRLQVETSPTQQSGAGTAATVQEKVCDVFSSLFAQQSDYAQFEDDVFTLLVAIGINTIYKFPPKQQAGKSDGYFQCGNLSVIYDATLRDGEEMLEFKQAQIDNYAARLANGRFDFDTTLGEGGGIARSFSVFSRQKEVWIINKGTESRRLKIIDGVIVKVICVDDLIKDVLRKRLQVSLIDSEDALASDLSSLGGR